MILDERGVRRVPNFPLLKAFEAACNKVRLAEQELARGDLMELGAGVFRAMEVETHFLSYRDSEGDIEKISVFRDWLMKQAECR